jgi:hypothetical protein
MESEKWLEIDCSEFAAQEYIYANFNLSLLFLGGRSFSLECLYKLARNQDRCPDRSNRSFCPGY